VGDNSEIKIDPRAVVHPGAQLDSGVEIGPFSVIGPHVKIGAGTVVRSHAVIEGRTTIGSGNRIFQFASVGTIPQDLKYNDEESELHIGDENQIRECSTIHIGTRGGGMVTHIGNRNIFMAYSHVAHDCQIRDDVVMANAATLAGHVTVEDGAIIGGLAGVHQFCRIGPLVMVASCSMVVKDVPPFTNVQGDRARLIGLNVEGMKRKGFSEETIASLKKAYRIFFRTSGTLDDAIVRARSEIDSCPEVETFLKFIKGSERGVTR